MVTHPDSSVLADINSFVPWPGFGPFESYDAEHTLELLDTMRTYDPDVSLVVMMGDPSVETAIETSRSASAAS